MRLAKIETKLREVLRESEDGLTVAQLVTTTGAHNSNVSQWLRRMPDAYIDRWAPNRRGPPAAVWCVVVPPPHCPHPTRQEP